MSAGRDVVGRLGDLGRLDVQARDRIGDRYELTYPIGRGGMGQVRAG